MLELGKIPGDQSGSLVFSLLSTLQFLKVLHCYPASLIRSSNRIIESMNFKRKSTMIHYRTVSNNVANKTIEFGWEARFGCRAAGKPGLQKAVAAELLSPAVDQRV